MPHIDWDFVKFVYEVVCGLGLAFAAYALLFLKSKFKPREEQTADEAKSTAKAKEEKDKLHGRINALAGELVKLDARLLIIEQSLKHAPAKEDITAVSEQVNTVASKLTEQMNGVANELAELRGEQKAQNNVLAMIHQHLLSGQGGA